MKLRVAKKILQRYDETGQEQPHGLGRLDKAYRLAQSRHRHSRLYVKTGHMRNSAETLVLEYLVMNNPSEHETQKFLSRQRRGIWWLRATLAGLLLNTVEDFEVRQHETRIRSLMDRFGAEPFDWLYSYVLEQDLSDWSGHGCFYMPKDEAERDLLKGDPDKVLQDDCVTLDHWNRKESFVAWVKKFDRKTGVASVLLDTSRFGMIRERQLTGRLDNVTLEDVPFDPARYHGKGRELVHKPGCWSR